jgi:hypothetical protein
MKTKAVVSKDGKTVTVRVPLKRTNCLWLCERTEICELPCNHSAFRHLGLQDAQSARSDRALFLFKLRANCFARLHKLVEQIEAERSERHVRLLSEINGGGLRIEHAHPRNGVVRTVPAPLAWLLLCPYLVFDRHYWREGRSTGDNISQYLFLAARAACALEYADVTGLASSVITIDHSEGRSELEGLAFRKRVHPPMMKDRRERDRSATGQFDRHMIVGERSNFLFFREPLRALANLSQRVDVVVREFAIQHKPTQGISLPSRAIKGPFKYLLEHGHCRSAARE